MSHVWVKSISYGTECLRRRRFSAVETDVELRKRGDQTGLETPLVHALNYDSCLWIWIKKLGKQKLKNLPGEYGRKAETQRNWP